MKKTLLILTGIIIGCIIIFAALYMAAPSSNSSDRYNIQYIEVTGKNGPVTLHNYMSKDSVKILLGKPDNVLMRTYRTDLVRENWDYHINGDYSLYLDFENGKLISVNQY